MVESTVHTHGVTVPASMLHGFRDLLGRELPDKSEALLQELGYLIGGEIFQDWAEWLRKEADVSDPGDLDAAALQDVLSSFFVARGWGSVELEDLGDSGMLLSSPDWVEASADLAAPYPSCFVGTGVIAGIFGGIAGAPVAVMEVECRSAGSGSCVYLLGSGETLERVYDAMASGRSFREALS